MGNKIVSKIAGWFVKKLWPQIQKLLIAFLTELFEWLLGKVKEIIFRKDDQQRNADTKAKFAEEMASSATTPDEAAHYKTMAQVWREVAETLRMENEELKENFGKVAEEGFRTITYKVNSLKVVDVFDMKNDDEIVLVSRENYLQLPSGKL